LARLGIHAASQDSQASEQGEFWEQKEGVTALSGENRGIERGGFKEVEEPMLSQQGDPVALKGAGRVGSEPILDVEPSGGEASDVPTPTVSTDETVKILETPLLPTLLVPHRPWAPRTLPDPRLARVDDVMAGLIEIVEVEGPMPCHRAYRLYAKAAGIGRVGRLIRSFFNRGIRKAIHLGLIDESNEYQRRDQMNQIVRKRGTPPVIPRTRGDRVFDEIPPAEIGLAMKFLLQQDPTLQGERLLYAVSRLYEIGRLTSNIQRALLWIKEQYVDRTGADGSF
jgi:hypothetical protein